MKNIYKKADSLRVRLFLCGNVNFCRIIADILNHLHKLNNYDIIEMKIR